MTQATQTPSLIALPPAVFAVAAEQGATAYLRPVLDLTHSVFPDRPVAVFVDEDPEIANDRHIILNVDVTGLDAEQMFACQQRWLRELFDHCPATHVCVFRLAMIDRP